MKYEVKDILSISDLIVNLRQHINQYTGAVWYRGQVNSLWSLEPRLMRKEPIISETYYFNKFKQDAAFILGHNSKTEFEWLFLMQHYGVPTRLLDWSESPLIALYFAINGLENEDGALWVLLPNDLNRKSNYRPDFEFEVPSFEDEHLKNYLPSTIVKESKSKLFPMAAIAPRNSTRMQAQQGVFTISHRENMKIEDVGDIGSAKDHIWKYNIPASAKKGLKEELKWLGINKFQLFPELESLSENLQ